MEKLSALNSKNYDKLIKRTWAEINLNKICENYNNINNLIKATSKKGNGRKPAEIMAIVKSDAYGHGVGHVARVLKDCGASWFGVADIDEAIQLREEGICEDILILGYTHPRAVSFLLENKFTQTVFSYDYAKQLSFEAKKYQLTETGHEKATSLNIHIKVDTGMSRLGVFCQSERQVERCADEIVEITSLDLLNSQGIFTHFACADEEENPQTTRRQYELFKLVLRNLYDKYNVSFDLEHSCNTAAALRFPEMHMDLVRVGIGLYGLYPEKWMREIIELFPAMQLKSVVSMLKAVPSETAASYNHIYTTKTNTTLATIPIGYADGYFRHLSGKSFVLVNGEKAPQVGRICMDQCLVDVTGIDNVSVGMTVTVFGEDNGVVLSVDDVADIGDTINYEIVCLVGKRVPRVFYLNGKKIGIINYILSKHH